jgi:hypothetical protein
VFDNGGGKVVVGDFTGHATQYVKRMSVAAGEGSEALAVRELDIQRPAVCVDRKRTSNRIFAAAIFGAEVESCRHRESSIAGTGAVRKRIK